MHVNNAIGLNQFANKHNLTHNLKPKQDIELLHWLYLMYYFLSHEWIGNHNQTPTGSRD